MKVLIPERQIELTTPSSDWAILFSAEKEVLLDIFQKKGMALKVEHVGSTSLNIYAKPTIDIAVGLMGAFKEEIITEILAKNNYFHKFAQQVLKYAGMSVYKVSIFLGV